MKRFRFQYGQISQLRSLWLVKHTIPFMALTATATSDVSADIIKNLEMRSPLMIVESPERRNIKYSIIKMSKDNPKDLINPFIDDLRENGDNVDRTIIFCQRLTHVRMLYRILDNALSPYYPDPTLKPYEKFQGNSDEKTKERITDSMTDPNGAIKLLIATVAFGMGVDCKKLCQIIHYGPPGDINNFCQETGRAGRDGQQSFATLVLYPRCTASKSLSKIMKSYCKNNEICRRELMLSQFPGQFKQVLPKHICCDVCAKKCSCTAGCKNETEVLSRFEREFRVAVVRKAEKIETASSSNLYVSETIKEHITEVLESLREEVLSQFSASLCYSGREIAIGFPSKAIKDIVNNLEKIKEPDDILKQSCILNSGLCGRIFEALEDVLLEEAFCVIDGTSEIPKDAESASGNASYFTDTSSEGASSSTSFSSLESYGTKKLRYRSRVVSESATESGSE